MIKQILKIIWNQRSANGWIFAELLIVAAILWVMMDSLLVTAYTYYSPLGFDIENVYKVSIGKMSPTTPGYVPDSLKATSDGEDLVRLADNLSHEPRVAGSCLANVACPYTWSNTWSTLIRAEADTTESEWYYQYFVVTPSYFDVFRMHDKEGRPLRQVVEQSEGDLVISADMESAFFDGQSGKGRKVKNTAKSSHTMTIAAVSTPIRQTEYHKSTACYYSLRRTDQEMIETINRGRAQNTDCMIRMEDGFQPEEMEAMLQGMGDRLTAGNLYISSITPLKEMRQVILRQPMNDMKKMCMMVGFMLMNVFFGIVGTFWLRTQYRQGEMGLRTALGSSRSQLKRFMDMEGLSLLAFAIPLLLVFIVNMLYFDMPDVNRMPYSWWRFAVTFGGALLLLAGMIVAGIWLPARKIAKMNPAEALHHE